MATFKFKNTDKVSAFIAARAARLARQAITDKSTARKIRGLFIRTIKKDLKLPSGEKVKSLKVNTAKRRRQLAKKNKTDKFYAPFKSNLTFTGRWLRSFIIEIKKEKNVKYILGPDGSHRGYVNLDGTREESIGNIEIGGKLIASGRDYTKIGKDFKKEIQKILNTAVTRALRKSLKL